MRPTAGGVQSFSAGGVQIPLVPVPEIGMHVACWPRSLVMQGESSPTVQITEQTWKLADMKLKHFSDMHSCSWRQASYRLPAQVRDPLGEAPVQAPASTSSVAINFRMAHERIRLAIAAR